MESFKEYMNVETGEVQEGLFITKEEYEEELIKQENKRNYLNDRRERTVFENYILDAYGSFYFNNYMKMLENIKNDYALAFRYLYLCTYADFDCVLRYGKNNECMKEKDLQEVFGLSRTITSECKSLMYEHNLMKKLDDGRLIINSKYCVRGRITESNKHKSSRVFNDGMRELYLNSLPKEHKSIGRIIPLLPYLNEHYNIICKRPLETDIKYIDAMTIKDVSECLDYDYSNITKLKKKLENITVNGLPLMAYVSHKNAEFFVINPGLFYKGNNLDELKFALKLFEVNNK